MKKVYVLTLSFSSNNTTDTEVEVFDSYEKACNKIQSLFNDCYSEQNTINSSLDDDKFYISNICGTEYVAEVHETEVQ